MCDLVLEPCSDKLRDTGLAREQLPKETMTTLFARIDRVPYVRTQWTGRVCRVGIFSRKIHGCDSSGSRGPEHVESGARELAVVHVLIGASKMSRKKSIVGILSGASF